MSVPFRIRYGRVATVDQASDMARAEQISVLARTHLGERPLVPNFGITDPTFRQFDPNELQLGIDTYGPPAARLSVSARYPSDRQLEVVVGFE